MAKDEKPDTPRRSGAKAKVKYLGDSDVRIINKGEDFQGRLATPLTEDLRWDWDNNHLLEVDLSDEALELLTEDPEFREVSGVKRLPVAAVAQRRKGIEVVGALNDSGLAEVGTSGGPAGTGEGSPSAT